MSENESKLSKPCVERQNRQDQLRPLAQNHRMRLRLAVSGNLTYGNLQPRREPGNGNLNHKCQQCRQQCRCSQHLRRHLGMRSLRLLYGQHIQHHWLGIRITRSLNTLLDLRHPCLTNRRTVHPVSLARGVLKRNTIIHMLFFKEYYNKKVVFHGVICCLTRSFC